MSFDAHKNFAYSTVATAPSPASSGTSLVVAAGDGSKFPAAPFNATVWPANSQPTTANAEIVRVTAKSTDTFTITRAQESSSARSIGVGDQIAATITAKLLTDIETVASAAASVSGAWSAGSYTAGQIVSRDNAWYLCTANTSDTPGSLFPPFLRANYTLSGRAHWTGRGRLQLTDNTSENGSAQAVSARSMKAFDLYMALSIPAADELHLMLFDSTDASLVANDYNFSANIGVDVSFSSFSSVNNCKILSRTVHGAAATTVAQASHTVDKTIQNYRVKFAANAGNWDVTVYDWTTSILTTTSLAVPASVVPCFGAWCGGSGGNWSLFPFDDASVSANWAPLSLGAVA